MVKRGEDGIPVRRGINTLSQFGLRLRARVKKVDKDRGLGID